MIGYHSLAYTYEKLLPLSLGMKTSDFYWVGAVWDGLRYSGNLTARYK